MRLILAPLYVTTQSMASRRQGRVCVYVNCGAMRASFAICSGNPVIDDLVNLYASFGPISSP